MTNQKEVIKKLLDDAELIKERYIKFLKSVPIDYRPHRRGGNVVMVGFPEHRWGEINSKQKEIQSKLIKDYKVWFTKSIELVRKYMPDEQYDFIKVYKKNGKKIKEDGILDYLELKVKIWSNRYSKFLTGFEAKLLSQISTLAAIYELVPDSIVTIPEDDEKLSEKFFIFMLMPFEDKLTEIYEQYIRKPLERRGHEVKKSDDFFKPTPILEDILDSISKADIIIAELTGRNPNVYYELGRAHEKKKYVIQISQDTEDIPFDLRSIRTILYKDSPGGYAHLKNQVLKFIEEYKKGRLL